MNILFISNDPNLFVEGSPARLRMRAYADALKERGGELHILARAPHTFDVHESPLHLYGVRTIKLLAPYVLSRHARKIIKSGNIKIISAQDPFEHGWAAARATRDSEARLHIQVHTDFLTPWFTRGHIYRSPHVRMPLLNRIRRRIAMSVLPEADGIRCVSERVKESLVARFGDHIPVPSVIPIAVDATVPPRVELPPLPFTFALIAVGRLEPEKRLEDVIAAVAHLRHSYPSLGACIVGGGRERRKLERMARKLRIADRIVFLGSRADARGLMQSAQAFIQASAYEGYGLTLIEAALSRVPIITTDVGIVGEVFEGYKEVLATAVGDPANLAAHIAWLIEDVQARKELVDEAEKSAREHLAATDSSPQAIIEDILTLA